jgi:TnpA family transposase
MAARGLSNRDIEGLTLWPDEIPHSDLASFFDLSVDDVRWLRSHRVAANQLGLGVQLCGLRYLGFIPDDLVAAPAAAVVRLADQLQVDAGVFAEYCAQAKGRTRRDHVGWVLAHAGWSTCGRGDWKRLGDWLVERALEHDTPSVLFRQALEFLRTEQIVRPGLDRLVRAIGTARATADAELFDRLAPLLTAPTRRELDSLIATDPELGVAPLVWLGTQATTASPVAITAEITKRALLDDLHVERLDTTILGPERRRQLAALARRSTPKALRLMAPERRYPILLAAVIEGHGAVTDELVQLFDRALGITETRTRHQVNERIQELAAANVERLALLDEILPVIINPDLDEAAVGRRLRQLDSDRLTAAVRGDDERLPRDGGHLELIEARFSYMRQFTPKLLAALEFSASVTPSETLIAIQLLQRANAAKQTRVPFDVPTGFVPARWMPYLDAARDRGDRVGFKHYWELCVLYALRDGLRSGEIWVKGSRRYANPASFLIQPEDWDRHRPDTLATTGQPPAFDERLAGIDTEISELLDHLDPILAAGDGPIRIKPDGQLQLSPLPAEVLADHVGTERARIERRLPMLPLPEILIEVDQQTGFTDHLTHAAGATPRTEPVEHARNLYAAVLAQACNFGTTRMAELSGISVDTLDWYTRWYLREETLQDANTAIINTHHRHPLAKAWGGGTLSSSDGLRLPMQGKSLTARSLSRYFVDEGITTYTHVSDQHTTFGTQVIVSTDRDATYVLDELLGNTTELAIAEHSTDSHGQTLATFALFDLVGLRLSPRIAKLTQKPLWRPHAGRRYNDWEHAGPLLRQHAQIDVIDRHWDDLLRVAESLKRGNVSAALLLTRLQAGSRQHPLAKALLEYGKLIRTTHTLRWFTDEAFRRRVGRQLNRGEALNDLRHFISFAHGEKVRHRHHEDQTMQAHCLSLVTNACILSTTTYLQDAIDAERADGHTIHDDTIAHLSPARFEQINPYGQYRFDITEVRERQRHPLRNL